MKLPIASILAASEYTKFNVTQNNQTQQMLIASQGPVALTDLGGGWRGASNPVYTVVADDLVYACAQAPEVSTAIVCTNNGLHQSLDRVPACPPPLPGEFSSDNVQSLTDIIPAGLGFIQLLLVKNASNPVVDSTFSQCAARNLSRVLADDMAAAPVTYKIGNYTSAGHKTAATSIGVKSLLAAAVLVAASV